MKVGLRLNGMAIGVDPDHPDTVYHNRANVDAWEKCELTKHEEGHFDVRFIAANRALSIEPDGTHSTRAPGTFNAFEQLYATTQPDGISLVYRVANGAALGALAIEEVE